MNRLVKLGNEHKAQFLKELPKSGGVVSIALQAIGITQQRYYTWLKEDEEFKAKVEDIKSELKAKNALEIVPCVDKARVRKWEKEIRNSVQITLNDVPLLRRRLEYLSEVSIIHDMWSARAKASDCSNATLSSYCSIAKVMAAALKDLDDVIGAIKDEQSKHRFTFDIFNTQPTEKKIVKL